MYKTRVLPVRGWWVLLVVALLPGISQSLEISTAPSSADGLDQAASGFAPKTDVNTGNSPPEVNATVSAEVHAAYGKLPLAFIYNGGAKDEPIKYYEQHGGVSTYFTPQGLSLHFTSKLNAERNKNPIKGNTQKNSQTVVSLSFVDGSKTTLISAHKKLAGRINYFKGNNPDNWHTNIPIYQELLYEQVYPGIDIRFYGNNQQQEYDIIVAPGADASLAKFRYENINGLRILDSGKLEISLSNGVMHQSRPVIFQDIKGKRVEIAGTFKLFDTAQNEKSNNKANSFIYGFEIAAYNPQYALIIDPSMYYSTYIGGTADDRAFDIAVDVDGNAYITGETASTDYPVSFAFQGSNQGGFDVFITKVNPDGTDLIYSTYIGGTGDDMAYGITVDNLNVGGLHNVYITGKTNSTNFPINGVVTAFQSTYGGDPSDMFVVKLDDSGSSLEYATYLGGNAEDIAWSIDVIKDTGSTKVGWVYIGGESKSDNFPEVIDSDTNSSLVTVANYQANVQGAIVILDTNTGGSADLTGPSNAGGLVYSTALGTSGGKDAIYGIATDINGLIYVTGETNAGNFTTTADAFQSSRATNGINGIVSIIKYDDASPLIFSSYFGGDGPETIIRAIDTDGAGSVIYITGLTDSLDIVTHQNVDIIPISNVFENSGLKDVFVAKIDLDVASATPIPYISYFTFLGGDGDDVGMDIHLNGGSIVFITGETTAATFINYQSTTDALYDTFQGGTMDAFLTMIDTTKTSTLLDGSGSLVYSTYIGGDGADSGQGIASDGAAENFYITGYTDSDDQTGIGFPVTASPFQPDLAGSNNTDAFITRFTFVANTIGSEPTVFSGGSTITFNGSTESGDTTLTTSDSGPTPPSGFKLGKPPIYYTIDTTINFSGSVEVCFVYDENRFSTEQNLKLFWWDGNGWISPVEGSVTLDTENDEICATFSEFISGEPYAIASESSTAISLIKFNAMIDGQSIVLDWTTSSEINNWGFRLLRSESATGPFISIVDELIPARGGIGLTMTYSYVDTSITTGLQYYYQLQDIDVRGMITAHNTISVQDPSVLDQYAQQSSTENDTIGANDIADIKQVNTASSMNYRVGPVFLVGLQAEVEDDASVAPDLTGLASEQEFSALADDITQIHDDYRHNPAISAITEFDGIDPVYKHRRVGAANTEISPRIDNDKASIAFNVIIKDAQGNVIHVNRQAKKVLLEKIDPTQLKVNTLKGKTTISWQVGDLQARGFALYRADKGKNNYQAIMTYIPNYGEKDGAVYNYQFTDIAVEGGQHFSYRLEVLSWGIKIARTE